ncbi:MAG: carbohydrate porin, partial [Gammaproteobacteria bacterium]
MKKTSEPFDRMRPGRRIAVVVLLHLGLSATPAAYADDAELEQLRTDVAELRRAYEARIGNLERRIEELETEQDNAPATPAKTMANTTSPPLASLSEEEQRSLIEKGLGAYDVSRGFNFHGYFRSGKGIDRDGNVMEPFQAPGSQAKYRLGNEGETYIETAFGYSFPELELPANESFTITLRPAFVVPDERFGSTPQFSIREAYAEGRGVWRAQPEAAFWAGERYYDRWDLHMNDFFYYDMSGFGGGVKDLQLGDFGKMAIAWLGGSIDVLESNGSTLSNNVNTKNTLDVRFYDIEMPGGKGFVGFNLASSQDSEMPNGVNVVVNGSNGLAGFFGYEMPKIFGGRYKAMLQYGVGAASNFRATEPDYARLDPPDPPADPLMVDLGESWHLRLVNDLVIEPTDKLSLQAALIYDEFDAGIEGPSKRRWVSLGVRPIHAFNDFFSLAVEAGVDHTGGDGLESGELYKLTIAPQITPGKGYFKRPAIRMFFTYASWS